MFEAVVAEHDVGAALHDELWAALWSRRYDDVDEPVWRLDATYGGIVVFARALDAETWLVGLDTRESFLVFRSGAEPPPPGSRVRVLPAADDRWRFADVRRLGLGIELQLDGAAVPADMSWVTTLRDGVNRLAELLETRRARLAARRTQLGAMTEPPAVESIWREHVKVIGERVAVETGYTPQEHRSLAKARAKGVRSGDEEEQRIVIARRARYVEKRTGEVARFRAGEWLPIRDRAAAARAAYDAYREEVIALEDAMQRARATAARAERALKLLDDLERAEFPVRALAFDPSGLETAAYAQELLRSIELLHAAIPPRSASAAHFSAYRAPTAGAPVSRPPY